MRTPLRALVVSDRDSEVAALARELEQGGYEPVCRRVDHPAAMSEALAEQEWDVVLADAVLEQFSGLAALMLLLNRDLDVPLLILSGDRTDALAVTVMTAGAHDLIRHNDLTRLVPAIERELRRARQRQEHKQTEEALRRRGEYLTCLTEISAELLAASDLDFTLTRVLMQLREVAGADRCYLFQNYRTAAGGLAAGLRLEDCAQGVESRFIHADYAAIDWASSGLDRWIGMMATGGAIFGPVAQLPESERALFGAQGVSWIIALPLRVAGEWYGFIGFDACRPVRWTEQEVTILRAAASAIAAAIRRLGVEERLRESEARYRALAENTYDLICEADREGRFLYVSPNYRDALGYEPTELSGRSYIDLIHPDDRDKMRQRLARGSEALPTGQTQFRFQHRNGEWRWFESTSKIFRTAAGEVRAVTVSRDVTERKWAEQRIEHLNRVVRAIRDIDRLITRENDRDRLLRQACEALVRVSDYHLVWIGLEDGEGHLVPVASAGGDASALEQWMIATEGPIGDLDPAWEAFSSGRPRIVRANGGTGAGAEDGMTPQSRILIPLQSGDERYGVMSVSAREDAFDDEEVELLVEVAGDIAFALTVIAMDAELRTYHDHLEELVHERTTELAMANRELEAFCYSVSHDLRAPLRSIDGFSQMLLEDHGDALSVEGRDYLQRVRAASQRMAQLIDDLLELSRLARSEVRREPVDLSALVRTIASELAQAQPQRRVTFAIAEGLVDNADPQLLRVMLENLVGNAWKFTAKHATARIEFGVRRESGGLVYFVRDDGAGFDMAYADKLFGAFQRLHVASEFDGNGIGLATVERIIQRHGGRIWAEGAVEQGATFHFTLSPADGARPKETPAGPPFVHAGTVTGADLR
jgi:PAS domain S-box-containing protein